MTATTSLIVPLRTSEAVTLLSLPQGSAQLLKEMLAASLEISTQATAEQSLVEAVEALGEVGVHDLSPLQAKEVLRQRIYAS